MKLVIFFSFILLAINGYSQRDTNYLHRDLSRWSADTGYKLNEIKLTDAKGKKYKVKSLPPKITLICHWLTSCGFEQISQMNRLQMRLRKFGMDSLVQLITVCIGNNKREWKKVILGMNKDILNFYAEQKEVQAQWRLKPTPAFMLLDETGVVRAKDFIYEIYPGAIDYILFAQTKQVSAATAYRSYRVYTGYINEPEESLRNETSYPLFKNWIKNFIKLAFED